MASDRFDTRRQLVVN
jgi:hypothetical protein